MENTMKWKLEYWPTRKSKKIFYGTTMQEVIDKVNKNTALNFWSGIFTENSIQSEAYLEMLRSSFELTQI